LSFQLPVNARGTIDQANKQITVVVPCDTDLSSVTGSVGIPIDATINPDIRKGLDLSDQSVDLFVTRYGNNTRYTLEVVYSTAEITQGLPSFVGSRACVGAACYTSDYVSVDPDEGRMFLFDCHSSEMVSVARNNEVLGPWPLSLYGRNNTHPYRNQGIGAALHIRSDIDPAKTYFFNKAGTSFVAYSIANLSYGNSIPLWKWGTDYSCPFSAVGAAMDVSVGTREIACLFNRQGTQYTLYESGQFSPPRSINQFRVRNTDELVAIPFSRVGAALRLDVSDRVVVAIFNGFGTEYVYVELGKSCVPGPYVI
ncbi:MAG: hypothetical protein AAF399_20535, partial [Bacteroidota bacterium]